MMVMGGLCQAGLRSGSFVFFNPALHVMWLLDLFLPCLAGYGRGMSGESIIPLSYCFFLPFGQAFAFWG